MSLDEIKIPKGTTGYKNDTKLFSSNEDTIKFTDGDVRDLSGIIRSGTGGYSSDIIDKSGTIAFKRQTSHTEILPYFFHLSVPRANRTPILCTQQISGNSLYLFFAGIVLPRLKKAIGEDHIAHMHPIFISDLYLNRYYENGQVKKITAIGHRRPNDAADDARQARVDTEINVSPAKRSGIIASVQEIFRGENGASRDKSVVFDNIKEIFELDLNSDEIKDIVVDVELNGKKRQIRVGRDQSTTFDITNEVDKDDDGHPELESIRAYTKDFVDNSLRPYFRGH